MAIERMLPVWLASVALLAVGIAYAPPNPLTQAERRVIDGWLMCIECDNAQLDSVRALGTRKPQATVDTLSRDLLAGPLDQRLANIQQQFATSYQTLAEQAASEGASVGVTQGQYVSHYLASFSAVYRIRAAIALAHIGGAAAGNALNAALDSAAAGSPNFGTRVQAMVRFGRDSLWTP